MKKRILTGDRPTGPLHLGHYIGSLKNRVKLQNKYDCFFIIADYQVLTDHLSETEKIQKNIKEIVLDYLSVGIDPSRSTIFIQSKIPAIAELTMFFSMMVSFQEVKRNPTVKTEFKLAKERGRVSEISYGFVGYPVSQAADILFVRAHLVPVGKDQLPHIELTQEIARRFNRLFTRVFPIPKPLVGEVPVLPGLDGKKMSKSLGNAIYLSDSPEVVKKKVMKAVTDPARIHPTDKGHPEVCNVFQYHKAFNKKEAKNGALISEFPLGTPPLQYNFPLRNRIIAGMSLATLIIEGKKTSGSLITANIALEEGREVFAVPGPIFSKTSEGPNNLIKEGAHPVTEAKDILTQLNIEKTTKEEREIKGETKEEILIIEFLKQHPGSIDQIIRETKINPSKVNSTLILMEIKGIVKRSGNLYTLAKN